MFTLPVTASHCASPNLVCVSLPGGIEKHTLCREYANYENDLYIGIRSVANSLLTFRTSHVNATKVHLYFVHLARDAILCSNLFCFIVFGCLYSFLLKKNCYDLKLGLHLE